MAKKKQTKIQSIQRRDDQLSRERIVDVSIELLDSSGESGLTFRALAEKLATGPGAIYWHVADKNDLLTAACDAIVARTLNGLPAGKTPAETIRAVALGVFDAIDAHPWIGSALTRAPGQFPTVRLMESLAQPLQALLVPHEEQWVTVGALLNYILGVAAQNAANGQLARARDLDRSDFLTAMATQWSQLDPDQYPFTRSFAARLPTHDDREDFIAGVDLILRGIKGGFA